MIALWHQYWSWCGSNVGAMPLQAAVGVAVTLAFRRPLSRAWHRLVGERADLEDVRRAAAAAHKIAADLYAHHTGRPHPDAPGNESGME